MSVLDGVPSSGLEFGYVGVFQTCTKTITLQNPLGSLVRYEILAEGCPFQISPLKGNSSQSNNGS